MSEAMAKIISYPNLFFWFSMTIILFGCNKSEDLTVYNEDLLFKQSFEINVAPYHYTDSSDKFNYAVSGDTNVNIVGRLPEFRWENVPSNILTIALFSEPIIVAGDEIKNSDKIIWQWHSSMDSAGLEIKNVSFSKVHYSWGKPVIDKKIQYNTQPLPLQNGLYYWALWSWDESGRWISYSSKRMKFRVE